MVHIIGFTTDGAFSDVVRELKSALSADGDRQSVLAFLDENSRITGMSMEEAVNAIESMDDSGNLTRMQEELVASMIEADGRYDRSEATTLLPAPLRKILDSIRSMISSVYKGLTGYNRLPENGSRPPGHVFVACAVKTILSYAIFFIPLHRYCI